MRADDEIPAYVAGHPCGCEIVFADAAGEPRAVCRHIGIRAAKGAKVYFDLLWGRRVVHKEHFVIKTRERSSKEAAVSIAHESRPEVTLSGKCGLVIVDRIINGSNQGCSRSRQKRLWCRNSLRKRHSGSGVRPSMFPVGNNDYISPGRYRVSVLFSLIGVRLALSQLYYVVRIYEVQILLTGDSRFDAVNHYFERCVWTNREPPIDAAGDSGACDKIRANLGGYKCGAIRRHERIRTTR